MVLASLWSLPNAHDANAQATPLISGAVGFITDTNGGNTTYIPTLAPLVAIPLGERVLIESKANLLEAFFPRPQTGYDTSHFIGLSYLQADIVASSHVTAVVGYFLTPFNTFNERISPIWINNFEAGPLISTIGAVGSASSLGGMLRGNAFENDKVSIAYAAYYSTASSNEQFASTRTSGGRLSAFFPRSGIEIGTSLNWILQDTHSRNVGAYVWWTPANSPLRLRSEYAHAAHAQGYWIEGDYRLTRFGGAATLIGRLEPVVRWQQTFRAEPDSSDGLPATDTQRLDLGLDYRLPHEVRINTAYSRQFSSAQNVNIWETGLIYRFLFPAWRAKR